MLAALDLATKEKERKEGERKEKIQREKWKDVQTRKGRKKEGGKRERETWVSTLTLVSSLEPRGNTWIRATARPVDQRKGER